MPHKNARGEFEKEKNWSELEYVGEEKN